MAINTPKPISRDERYLSKIGGNEEVIVPKPVSREEKYMYRAAGYDDQPIPDYPIGRNEKYWAKIVENGGGSSTLIEKSITENGVYNASDDEADGYSEVTVNVPEQNNAKFIKASGDVFNHKTSINKLSIPDGYTVINDSFGFGGLTGLKEVEIPSSMTKIGLSSMPTGVEKIIIHKSENSISGAPWGATNAQVIWIG